jgi:hypothetical protein
VDDLMSGVNLIVQLCNPKLTVAPSTIEGWGPDITRGDGTIDGQVLKEKSNVLVAAINSAALESMASLVNDPTHGGRLCDAMDVWAGVASAGLPAVSWAAVLRTDDFNIRASACAVLTALLVDGPELHAYAGTLHNHGVTEFVLYAFEVVDPEALKCAVRFVEQMATCAPAAELLIRKSVVFSLVSFIKAYPQSQLSDMAWRVVAIMVRRARKIAQEASSTL